MFLGVARHLELSPCNTLFSTGLAVCRMFVMAMVVSSTLLLVCCGTASCFLRLSSAAIVCLLTPVLACICHASVTHMHVYHPCASSIDGKCVQGSMHQSNDLPSACISYLGGIFAHAGCACGWVVASVFMGMECQLMCVTRSKQRRTTIQRMCPTARSSADPIKSTHTRLTYTAGTRPPGG